MIIRCKNFGPILDGQINISKDLLIICGENGTGKSYLSYLLYGLARLELQSSSWNHFISINDYTTHKADETSGFVEYAIFNIDLLSTVIEKKGAIEVELAKRITEVLDDVFPDTSNFLETSFEVILPDDLVKNKALFENRYALDMAPFVQEERDNDVVGLQIVKNKKSHLINFRAFFRNQKANESITNQLLDIVHDISLTIIYKILQEDDNREAYFFPAERIALDTFNWDIVNSRPKLNNDVNRRHSYAHMIRNDQVTKPGMPFKRNIVKSYEDAFYPMPIHDFIMRSTSYAFERDIIGQFRELGEEIESFLGLRVELLDNRTSGIAFGPKSRIPLKLSSSTIKSLTSFILYLKHESTGGDIIFFDEPELSLHPSIQRKLTLILAKLVRRGVKVVVCTHSDFILREFNNLIMLNKESGKAKKLRLKYENLGYTSNNTLPYIRVGVNVLEKGTIESIPITEEGFSINSIDKVIIEQNSIAEDIYYSIFQDETN